MYSLKDRSGKAWKDSDADALASFVAKRNLAIEQTCFQGLRQLRRARQAQAFAAVAPAQTVYEFAPPQTVYSTYVPQAVQSYSTYPVVQESIPVQMIAPPVQYQMPMLQMAPQRVLASPQAYASPQAATGLSFGSPWSTISASSCASGICPR